MPVLLEETQINLDRADLFNRTPVSHPNIVKGRINPPSRSTGIHLSGVLSYIAITSKMVDWAKEAEEERLKLRMALGLAWEEFCISLYPNAVWQPGEELLDSVAMNCDGLSEITVASSGDCHTLEEFKLTWSKRRTGKEIMAERWYWMSQIKGYCAGYGCHHCRLHVCYVNGDYKPMDPVYMRYLIEFSHKEIDDNWKMVIMNRERAREAGYGE
jgi:hypothetical protein